MSLLRSYTSSKRPVYLYSMVVRDTLYIDLAGSGFQVLGKGTVRVNDVAVEGKCS